MAKEKGIVPVGVPEESFGRPSDDSATKPKFGTAKSVDVNGQLPRIIDPLDRVQPGMTAKRFKCLCKIPMYGAKPFTYVLAENEADARKAYVSHIGLEAEMARINRGINPDHKIEAAITCYALAD